MATLEYLDTAATATYLGVPESVLIKWREQGIGPAWFENIGGPLYRMEDLDDWIRSVSSSRE